MASGYPTGSFLDPAADFNREDAEKREYLVTVIITMDALSEDDLHNALIGLVELDGYLDHDITKLEML